MNIKLFLKNSIGRMLNNEQKALIKNLKFKIVEMSPSGKRALRHMENVCAERPIGINIETRTLCNAKCVFCARSKLKTNDAVMTMEVFEKICSDFSGIGGGGLGFSPLIGETLLDPFLMERVRLLGNYPNIHPNIYTNAISFEKYDDNALEVILSAMRHLDISIGGLDRESYKLMFGADRFDTVWNSLSRISRINSKIARSCKISLHIRTNNKMGVLKSEKYRELKGRMGFSCSDVADSFSPWGGLINKEDLPEGASLIQRDNSSSLEACLIPMMNIMFLPSGKALACSCMDAQGILQAGDINESSIREIWKGDAFTRIRNSFKDGNIGELCRTCSYYIPYKYYFSNPSLASFSPDKDSFWELVNK
jgi:hypothetical protein